MAKKQSARASGAAPNLVDAETATYTVVSPLNHDQVDYAIGEEIDLTEDEAKPLLGHTVKPTAAAAAAES